MNLVVQLSIGYARRSRDFCWACYLPENRWLVQQVELLRPLLPRFCGPRLLKHTGKGQTGLLGLHVVKGLIATRIQLRQHAWQTMTSLSKNLRTQTGDRLRLAEETWCLSAHSRRALYIHVSGRALVEGSEFVRGISFPSSFSFVERLADFTLPGTYHAPITVRIIDRGRNEWTVHGFRNVSNFEHFIHLLSADSDTFDAAFQGPCCASHALSESISCVPMRVCETSCWKRQVRTHQRDRSSRQGLQF